MDKFLIVRYNNELTEYDIDILQVMLNEFHRQTGIKVLAFNEDIYLFNKQEVIEFFENMVNHLKNN